MKGKGGAPPGRGWGATLVRLLTTEWLPLAGWLTMWAAVAAFVRPADVARLLAMTVLTRAIREVGAMETGLAVRRRWSAGPEVRRDTLRLAVRIELATLAGELALLAALAGLLAALDQERAVTALLILALAFPARHFAAANGGMRRQGLHRTAMALAGVALVGAALLAGWRYEGIAAAVAAREWLALGVTYLPFARLKGPPGTAQRPDPPHWREVAGITGARARARLYYRVTKGIFSIFGPIGSAIVRTSRGLGAHRKLDRYVPQRPRAAGALALVLLGVTAGLLAVVREPATLVIAGGILRVAGAAGSAALWAPYATEDPLEDDEDEED